MAASSCCRASGEIGLQTVDHRLTFRHLGLQRCLLDPGLRARLLCRGVGFGCRALHERVNHPGHAGLARLNRRFTRTFDERLLDGGERATPFVVVQSGRFVLANAHVVCGPSADLQLWAGSSRRTDDRRKRIRRHQRHPLCVLGHRAVGVQTPAPNHALRGSRGPREEAGERRRKNRAAGKSKDTSSDCMDQR